MDQNSLQRYMPGDKAIKVINDDGFYFRRADKFTDKTEGDREYWGDNEQKILKENKKIFGNLSSKDAENLGFDYKESEKQHVFIQSWFKCSETSRLMWNEYAKYNENYNCALFHVNLHTIANFYSSIVPKGFYSDPIKYVDDKNKERNAFYTKNKLFEFETEYRFSLNINEIILFNKKVLPELNCDERNITIQGIENDLKSFPNEGKAFENKFHYIDNFGFILKVPLNKIIKDIFIPEKASDEFERQLNVLLKEKNYPLECERIKIPED